MRNVPRIRLYALLMIGLLGPGLALAAASVTLSGQRYQLQIEGAQPPVAINQMLTWEVELRDAQGDLVPDAQITVDGGMPSHHHGLPTAPRVTQVLGPGRYRIEGLKFQMPGEWALHFRIEADPGIETLTLTLDL